MIMIMQTENVNGLENMKRKRETSMYRLQIRFKIQSKADIIFQIISEEDIKA